MFDKKRDYVKICLHVDETLKITTSDIKINSRNELI